MCRLASALCPACVYTERKDMKTITITRKRKFASALMPFWIIVSRETRQAFMDAHGIESPLGTHDALGQPVPRIAVEELDQIGIRISNGQTIEVPVEDDAVSLFVSTMDGSLSNEIRPDTMTGRMLVITVRGGLTTVSYPYLEELQK